MFSKKLLNPILKCKQIYALFICLLCSVQFLLGQVVVEVDSVALAQQDSLLKVEKIQDSLSFQYVTVNSSGVDYYLDSIRSLVVVDDNDFVGWMKNMDALTAKDHSFVEMAAVHKVQRPVWILVVVFCLFISIGLVRVFFYNNFHNIVFGFYNDRVLAQINKEDSLVTSWPYIFLYCIFTFSLGLFITLYQSFILHQGKLNFLTFLNVSLVIALLFLLKIIFVRLVGVLFEIERLIREYIVFLYLFYFNSILILMPLLLIVTFVSPVYFNFILIFFLSIIGILFLYRFLKILTTLFGGLRFSIFYLILYLCTLEIAPILILVKSLNN